MASGRPRHLDLRWTWALPPRGLLLLLAGCSAGTAPPDAIAALTWLLPGLSLAMMVHALHQVAMGSREGPPARLGDVDARTSAALRRVDELQAQLGGMTDRVGREIAIRDEIVKRIDRSDESVRALLTTSATRQDLDHLRSERVDGDRALGVSVEELRLRQERHEHDLAELRKTVDGVATDVHGLRTDVDELRTTVHQAIGTLSTIQGDTTKILSLLGARS